MVNKLDYIYFVQKQISLLSGISDLLYWDGKTHMPERGVYGRSEQLKLINGLISQQLTSKRLYAGVRKLLKKRLPSRDYTVLKELEKNILKERRLPKDFQEELAKTTAIAQSRWENARKLNDFGIFKPELKKLVEMNQKYAYYIDPKREPYDVLLAENEEGMTSAKLTEIFSELKKELKAILEKIKQSERYDSIQNIKLTMSKKEQQAVITELIAKMGATNDKVALGTSTHPFTISVSREDVRITARYINPASSLLDALHEAGHAQYELGLPKDYYMTFVYGPASLGLDESQAFFWEDMVGKSKFLWETLFEQFKPFANAETKWQDFYNYLNRVRPSIARTEADEITYCLHIIMRYEIERDLINGKLDISSLSEVWNSKLQEIFGIVPSCDKEGILQDIHWADSDFGYFPCYCIGRIYSSQIYRQISKDIQDLPQLIRKQEFGSITEWLRQNIHEKGKTMPAEEIIRKSCGSPLNPKAFTDYLKEKYSEIYNIQA